MTEEATVIADDQSDLDNIMVGPLTEEESKLQATAAAQSHVAAIRSGKGLDQDNENLGPNVSDLTAALNVLSSQLYTQPTHFLLEFIQNADDNTYATDVLPTITFHNNPGQLLITCNETGFQPKNVEAICRIAHSTKRDRSKGFIGEKGIGFKSVFKIATTVHISSNAYTFRFDREGPLGMIAPIWCSFPQKVDSAQTQFLLQITDEKDSEKQLRQQLRKLDSTLLLFLRNLKQISVSIDDGSRTVEGKFTKHIFREDTLGHSGEMVRIWGDHKRLRRLNEDSDYLVVRHTAQDMPVEAKRLGMHTSEVVLAFPFKNNKPTFFKQRAYAFLPVRESGYRFLLQGDFILTASRESLEAEVEWNERLLWAVAECFAKAVERFNSAGAEAVRYTWPGFLHDLPTVDAEANPFSPLSSRIINTLKMRSVFETQGGAMVRPGEAVYVPAAFRDEEGDFVLAGHAEKKFLVNVYEQHDPTQGVLRLLGVDVMDFAGFLELLKGFISDHFQQYTAKSSSWHSDIARILLDKASSSQLKSLPIIPLTTNGDWLRPVDGQCHFETSDAKAGLSRLPEGISNLRIVSEEAALEPARRRLLEKIGVKNLDRSEVCRLLVQLHGKTERPPDLHLEALIDHIEYIYEVAHEGRHTVDTANFWVQDCNGNLRRANTVYQDALDDSPKISSVLPSAQWGSLILHPGYLMRPVASKRLKWSKWLTRTFGIRDVLRIVDEHSRFTPEFSYVVATLASNQVLEILAASWLKDPGSLGSTTVKQNIGAIEVACDDGHSKSTLRGACLPTPELKGHAPSGMPFLLLNKPAASKWNHLSEFGVVTRPNLVFYLRCLTLLQGKKVSCSQLVTLYSKIDGALHADTSRVRDYFRTNAAIFVPSANVWASARQCCWEPTPGVAGELALAQSYPALQSFFFDHLQVRSATIEKVADQLREMSQPGQAGDLGLRKLLILALSRFVHKNPASFAKVSDRLQNVPLMPISAQHGMMSTQLSSMNKETWLFCDRHEYHAAFKGMPDVKFADFNVQEYPLLEPLDRAISKAYSLKKLHCLSDSVGEVKNFDTNAAMNTDLTAFLRSKVKYLRRIMRFFPCPDLKRKLDQLHHLKVLHAPNLAIRVSLARGQLGPALDGRPIIPKALYKDLKSEVAFYVRNEYLTPELKNALGMQMGFFTQTQHHKMKMLLYQVIMIDDDQLIYDMLASSKVGGFEEHEYQQLPVQPEIAMPATGPTPLSKVINQVGSTASAVTEPPLLTPAVAAPPQSSPTPSMTAISASGAMQVAESTLPVQPEVSRLVELTPGRTLGTGTTPESRMILRAGYTGGTALMIDPQAATRIPRLSSAQRTVHVGSAHARPDSAVQFTQQTENERPSSSSSSSGIALSEPQIAYRRSPKLTALGNFITPVCSVRVPTFKSEADQRREQRIGAKGELYVYNLLKEVMGVNFPGEKCWTSELRKFAGNEFTRWKPDDPDENYADFTTMDPGGQLLSYLRKQHDGLVADDNAVFHVEVKTTAGACNEVFHMSNIQMEMAEEYAENTRDIFIIFRVFNVDASEPGLKIFLRPYEMMLQGTLVAQPAEWLVQEQDVEVIKRRSGRSSGAESME